LARKGEEVDKGEKRRGDGYFTIVLTKGKKNKRKKVSLNLRIWRGRKKECKFGGKEGGWFRLSYQQRGEKTFVQAWEREKY